ncbi:B-cell receptor CD22-like isoform X3 [Acanthochromis polyacanthus]|uniref:B-cell receptor CD22-like isoform X3 n=1 Tax=Acanthochromis polyacanthus TaxID=80966 RepID=UPI002233E98C|nr:B-cell receptor CD22-like isoform X3 [Acanthochromis polyacanthus]XP_051796132.1 B-cell receptor CD22-like isoform X3 [Acanthochromis polyacanthus]
MSCSFVTTKKKKKNDFTWLFLNRKSSFHHITAGLHGSLHIQNPLLFTVSSKLPVDSFGNKCVPVNMVFMLLISLFVSGALGDCSKTPSLFITAPKKMEALSGSCLLIPCSFSVAEDQNFNTARRTFGVWIKDDSTFLKNPKNVIFNSSGTVTTYPMEITGNLSQRNCTTLFSDLNTNHTDTYFFRIENEQFKATASCDRLEIEVHDSPWSPTINISGEVKEKKSVTISCSAFTPCPHSPPQLTWNLPQNSHSQIEENTDGTFTSKIQQSITLSHSHDGFNISCSATYPVDEGKPGKTKETQQTLSVPYAPKETSASISPSGLVSAGSWVNLTCSSRANPPVSNFSWFLRTEDGPMKVAEGYLHKLKMTNMTESYYCVATNDLGHDTSLEINLYIPENGQPSSLGAVVGGITGAIVLMSVVFILWRLKSTRSTSHQVQNTLLQEQTRTAENEGIHYGEIDFSKLRPGPSSDSMKDNRQQTDVVYSQVKVCKSSTQTADGPESIYAQVKKK